MNDEASIRAALEQTLDPGEEVALAAAAVGSMLFLTNRRLLLVREGSTYRPRSGIRAWPVDQALTVRFNQSHRGTSQVLIRRDGRSVSVFVNTGQLADVLALVEEIRRRIYAED